MTYVPNPAAIELAGRAAGRIGQEIAGEQILETAVSIAPVETGAYQASLYKTTDGDDVVVGSDIRYARYLEFGTSDTPVFATLRRASDSANV